MVGTVIATILLLTVAGLLTGGPSVVTAIFDTAFQTPVSLAAAAGSVRTGLALGILNPWYWTLLAVLSALQWIWPARRDQRAPSVELAVDAVWFVMGNAMRVTVVAFTLGAVAAAYQQMLGTWSLNLQPALGFWGLAVFAFVMADLLAWISHWCHHGVQTLWWFHSVHHAQQNLNVLADNKQHVGETVCAALIVFIPSQILGLNTDAAGALTFVTLYYSAVLHSNIRTNFGPLRYFVMSPQSHRIHHSILPQHFNTNFATVFSCWDYLAGTRYHGNDEYPPTGIDDTDFPLERPGANPWRWVTTWWEQMVYPFRAMAKARRRRRVTPAPTPTSHASPWLREQAETTALHRLERLQSSIEAGRGTRTGIARPSGSTLAPVGATGPPPAQGCRPGWFAVAASLPFGSDRSGHAAGNADRSPELAVSQGR